MGSVNGFNPVSKQQEFEKIYKEAKKWHCPCAVVYFLARDERKFSPVVSKKVGNAVVRNRSKRVLRALFSNFEKDLHSGFYVIVAKQNITNMSFKDIESNLRWSFKKIGSIK